MKVALSGPSHPTEMGAMEIAKYARALLSGGDTLVILAHSSIEKIILSLLVKHPEHAHQLEIYTFPLFQHIPKEYQDSITYLVNRGAVYHSLAHGEEMIKRGAYVKAWGDILTSCDSLIAFYDGKKPSLLIPADEAKRRGKNCMIYYLANTPMELEKPLPERIKHFPS